MADTSPRPWKLVIVGIVSTIFDANGEVVLDDEDFYPAPPTEADMTLIVSAVNAEE